jgi:hypothetical protein
LVAAALGCAAQSDPGKPAPGKPAGTATPYVLIDEPAGAKSVAEVRRTAKDNDEVVAVGRVGGSTDPFVEGAAAFTLVDASLKPCSDGCPTPWDYCCDAPATVAANSAMVQVVDADGRLVATGAKNLLGVKELSEVVVRGKAKRDGQGNLTILASGVYRR